MQLVFGKILVFEDIDSALSYHRSTNHSLRLVTLDGEVINSSGAMTGGRKEQQSKTIMKRKIERNKLELQILDKKQQLSVFLQTNLRNLHFGLQEDRTAKLSLSLAKDLLDNEVEKLKLGKSTSYNVSLAQQKSTNAKLSETLTRVKSERNFISLLVLTGKIFDYFAL